MTETVKHKGKEYQIGKIYEFQDEGCKYWCVGILNDINGSEFPFLDQSACGRQLCREISPESLGKITNAKIEPEAGKLYKISNGVTVDYAAWSETSYLCLGWKIICEMVEKND